MPRIELIDVAPPDVSAGAEAFVGRSADTIYLITSSPAFRDASRDSRGMQLLRAAMQKLASILAHEEWHVRHGPDEKSAYEYQLVTLIRLGVQPGYRCLPDGADVDAAGARGAQAEPARNCGAGRLTLLIDHCNLVHLTRPGDRRSVRGYA